MDKYIVEIEGKNTCTYPDGEKCLAFHVESDSGKAVICTKIPLTPYTEPDTESIRKEAYQQGINDAREGKASCQFCEYERCSDRVDPCRICACNYMNFFEPKKQEEMDGLRQNIQTIVDQCGYSLDEIAEVLAKMKES